MHFAKFLVKDLGAVGLEDELEVPARTIERDRSLDLYEDAQMTAFLLDTGVISKLARSRPSPLVTAWLTRTPDAFLSILRIGEMLRGAQRISTRDPIRAERIEAWVANVRSTYPGHLLEIGEDVADEWARLPSTRTLPVIDGLLAATAPPP